MECVDDPPCTWCGDQIGPAETIVISPEGHMHGECWAASGNEPDTPAEPG